jgi:hypothetical protein
MKRSLQVLSQNLSEVTKGNHEDLIQDSRSSDQERNSEFSIMKQKVKLLHVLHNLGLHKLAMDCVI